MIEIFRHHSKWRIKIENETLQFNNSDEFEDTLIKLAKLKEDFEPYKTYTTPGYPKPITTGNNFCACGNKIKQYEEGDDTMEVCEDCQ